MLKNVGKLLNPLTYVNCAKEQWVKMVLTSAKDFRAGSPAPLFKAIGATCVVCYSFKYVVVGQYKNAEKQRLTREALKDFHH